MADRVFGHIPGVAVGTIFPDRRSLSQTGVHRPPQSGISGNKTDGADSIVVSGGYRDDRDYGDLIIYTGQGGNDPSTKRQVADQELKRGNIGLALSCDRGLPVRVVRGSNGEPAQAPSYGYRYDGLYSVTRYWPQRGADGYLIWRFELCQFPGPFTHISDSDVPLYRPDLADFGSGAPRTEATVQRLVLNTPMGSFIKDLHDSSCQFCGTHLETPTGSYAEVVHVRPLGPPHNGPDVDSNILCVCPNCHIQFDRFVLYIEQDGTVHRAETGEAIGVLRSHHVDPNHFAYHRELCQLIQKPPFLKPPDKLTKKASLEHGGLQKNAKPLTRTFDDGGTNNPEWVEEEAVLLLDLYLRLSAKLQGRNPTFRTPEVVALSELLNRLMTHLHPPSTRKSATFRNPSGIELRYKCYVALDETNKRKGLKPSAVFRYVYGRYGNNPDDLRERVSQILKEFNQ